MEIEVETERERDREGEGEGGEIETQGQHEIREEEMLHYSISAGGKTNSTELGINTRCILGQS